MARTDLSTQNVSISGLEPAYTAAHVDGHMFRNTGREFLHVINASGGGVDVTIETPNTVDGNAIADRVVTVAAGTDEMIGTFHPGTYNQPSGADRGKVYIDTDTQASITYGVIKA